MIGGGGLLAWPHVPLADAKWVGGLKTPVALWGIGADAANASNAAELIRRADYVSGRCVVSLEALGADAKSVHYVCDPVLADCEIAPPRPGARASRRVCWVLRGPLSELHAEIARHIVENDVVLCFEDAIDGALRKLFPQMLTVRSAAEFARHAARARRIVSMRYHGLVLGARIGVPVFSLAVDKGARLMRALGLPDRASDAPAPLVAARAPGDARRTSEVVNWHAELHRVELARILDVFVPFRSGRRRLVA